MQGMIWKGKHIKYYRICNVLELERYETKLEIYWNKSCKLKSRNFIKINTEKKI